MSEDEIREAVNIMVRTLSKEDFRKVLKEMKGRIGSN